DLASYANRWHSLGRSTSRGYGHGYRPRRVDGRNDRGESSDRGRGAACQYFLAHHRTAPRHFKAPWQHPFRVEATPSMRSPDMGWRTLTRHPCAWRLWNTEFV